MDNAFADSTELRAGTSNATLSECDLTGTMDFFIIANAWSAGKDNPTSKHRIALELVRQGHRVLWVEGSGMRTPSVGSSHDRLRMVRKVVAAFRGAREEGQSLKSKVKSRESKVESRKANGLLHVLSPLFIPLPQYELIRRLNGLICRLSLRFWGWRLGFKDPVLINYVPVLAEAMRGWRRISQTSGHRPQTIDQSEAQVAADVPAAACLCGGDSVRRDGERHLGETSTPRPPRVVYHCVDRWDAFAMYDSAMMGEMDRRCCRYADLVIASAGELYDRCKAINPNTVLIPHGVDWEHFRSAAPEVQTLGESEAQVAADVPAAVEPSGSESVRRDVERHPEDLLCGLKSVVSSRPTIGFFGLLSEWVDQDLLLRLAKEFSGTLPLPSGERVGVRVSSPRAKIILIGKADVDVTRLQGVPNIQLLGPKPFSELPAYIAGFTVGIIPFVVNDLTRSVNPIKLREMLSVGCPVVSTDLPEVARYEVARDAGDQTRDHRPQTKDQREENTPHPAVQVAHNHDEFVAMISRVLENPFSQEERKAVSDSMSGETWTAKVGELLALITHDEGV